MPTVSVILPTYNRSGVLPRAIRSVLAQSYQSFELIVVDDGSTDETPQILSSLDDPRLRIVRQPNAGLSAARNRAVAESVGEYLAFLDDDDEFLPHTLEHQVAYLERHPEAGLVAGGHECVDECGTVLAVVEPWLGEEDLSVELWLRKCPFLLQSILLRRSWWDRAGGLDPELRQAMDHIFFLRLAAEGCTMHRNRETVFRYCLHGGGMSQNAYRLTQFRIKGLTKFFDSPVAPGWAKASRDQWYAYHWVLGAMHAYALGQVAEARQSLLQAVGHDPQLADLRSQVFVEQVVEFSNSPLLSVPPLEYARFVFEQLPEELSGLRRHYRMVRARLHMRRFFESHRQGDTKGVLSSVLPGVFLDPSWLRNRGVWSITAKALNSISTEICRIAFRTTQAVLHKERQKDEVGTGERGDRCL